MKKAYYCPKLESTLNFVPQGLKFCCVFSEGVGFLANNLSDFSPKNILKNRQKYINMFKKGIIPQQCANCSEYKEYKWQDRLISIFKNKLNKKITHIIINHFKQCDCSCIYCSQKQMYAPNISQNYELLPIIKQLYDEKFIDESGSLQVNFQGGNVSVLKEFEALVQEFFSKNCTQFDIFINAIKYSSIFDNQSINFCITVSVDAGTRETFKKIKAVDKFDDVISNIKKLAANSNINLLVKYIIINDVNDNIKEVESFLNIMRDLHVKNIVMDVDFSKEFVFKKQEYQELLEFVKKYCKNNDMNCISFPKLNSYIEKVCSD